MPSARANIIAKLNAQTEMSSTCAPRNSEPAAATRPVMVSMSGRPAATSEPNATTRISSVTGHEITSLFSIAVRLAWLKSDHRPDAPVRCTSTPSAPAFSRPFFASSAARTMSLDVPAAAPCTTAVCPSSEIDRPGCGGITRPTNSVSRSVAVVFAIAAWKAGSVAVCVSEWTTTCSAELESPPTFSSMSWRACTDSEPEASQPAPDRADSTRGAKTARIRTRTPQPIATCLKWVAV
ncbi:unannotated protein [freshwater metagenome]|uniref:Unannotated protein n=1 Tax=freshwater metagenome TaxID=449393 RepID=A0A6J7J2L3_9ZZZZ